MNPQALVLGTVLVAGLFAISSPQGKKVKRAPGQTDLEGAAMPKDDIPGPVRTSVKRGMQWLLRAQNRDGSWGDNSGSRGDISNTCIATLALCAAGHTTTRGRYAPQLRRGVEYVMRRLRGFGHGRNRLDSATLIQNKLGPNIDVYYAALLAGLLIGFALFADVAIGSPAPEEGDRPARG